LSGLYLPQCPKLAQEMAKAFAVIQDAGFTQNLLACNQCESVPVPHLWRELAKLLFSEVYRFRHSPVSSIFRA
jgi:hypothetical protein